MRLLKVRWHDAVSNHLGWGDLDAVRSQKPAIAETVGWEVARVTGRGGHLTLVASLIDDKECSLDTTIPLGMIISEEELATKETET